MKKKSIIEFIEEYAEHLFAQKFQDYKYYKITYDWQYLNDCNHVVGVIVNIRGFWHVLYFNKPVIKEKQYESGEFYIKKQETLCINDPSLVHVPDIESYAKSKQQMIDNVYKSFNEYKHKFNRFPGKISINCLPEYYIKLNDKFEYTEKEVNISIKNN